MIKSSICAIVCLSVLAGCSSHIAMMQKDKYDTSTALDEIRIELSDLKHTVNNTQVELQILDDKVKHQDTALSKNKVASASTSSSTDQRIAFLEKRLSHIESGQEKLSSELKSLNQHASQTSSALTQYRTKIQSLENEIAAQHKLIEELSDIKSTLSSISQAVKKNSSAAATALSSDTYKVKAGDSLEKIARSYKTTVDAIKKANNLSSNKIMVGQEITIPHD